MTDEEKFALVQLMTEGSDVSDAVVTAYLTLAKQIIFEKAFPFGNFPEVMPAQYDGVHVEIAAYLINKRGAEGETVHLENGVSRHWEDGSLPPSLIRRIIPFAGVPKKVQPEPDPEPDPEDDNDEIGETEP